MGACASVRRITIRAGAAAAAALLALSVYTVRTPIAVSHGDNLYSLDRGQLQIIYRPDSPLSRHAQLHRGLYAYTGMPLRIVPSCGFDGVERVAYLELQSAWIIGALGLGASGLWWQDRKQAARAAAGQKPCPKCNYDRTGLVGDASAPCPECGTVPGDA